MTGWVGYISDVLALACRNTKEVSRELGVCSVHCPRGLTMKAFEEGLALFDAMHTFIEKGGTC